MKDLSCYIDIAFCVVVFPLMVALFPVERWIHNFPSYMTGALIWLYALYFINRRLVVPLLFRPGAKRWAAIIIVVLSVAVTAMIADVKLYPPKPSVHDAGVTVILPRTQQYQQAIWSLFMIVQAFSFAVGLLTCATRQRSERLAAEAERDKAVIELYKAQVKPHFMFNTLNSIYGLFVTRSPRAIESLEKYITMMRYIHVASVRDNVTLADEADYIRQYVGLQSLRLNDKTTVALDIDIESPDLLMPPLLLISFVENCFKHGVSPVEECRIAISLTEHGGKLILSTSNRIFPRRKDGERLGVANTRKRLELLYPRRHTLVTSAADGVYRAELSIDLTHHD